MREKLLKLNIQEFPMAEYVFRTAVAKHLETQDMFWKLEEMAKDVLAGIMDRIEKGIIADGDKISENKLERLARCDPEWLTYKQGLYEARIEAGRAKARFVQAEKYWATLQSGLAYKRDEMMHLHGAPEA